MSELKFNNNKGFDDVELPDSPIDSLQQNLLHIGSGAAEGNKSYAPFDQTTETEEFTPVAIDTTGLENQVSASITGYKAGNWLVDNAYKDIPVFAYNSLYQFGKGIYDLVDAVSLDTLPDSETVLSPQKSLQFFGASDSMVQRYNETQAAQDTTASLASGLAGGTLAFSAMAKGSKLYNFAKASGISDRVANVVFADIGSASAKITEASKRISDVAKLGVQPGAVGAVKSAVGSAVKTSVVEGAKLGATSEAVTRALNLKNNVMYPEDMTTSEKIGWQWALPIAVSATLEPIQAWATLRRLKIRGAKEAATIRSDKLGLLNPSIKATNGAGLQLDDLATVTANEVANYDKYIADIKTQALDGALSPNIAQDSINFLHKEKTVSENQMRDTVKALTKSDNPEPLFNTSVKALKKDPNALYGADEIFDVPVDNEWARQVKENWDYKFGKLSEEYDSLSDSGDVTALAKKDKELSEHLAAQRTYGIVKSDGSIIPMEEYHVSLRDAGLKAVPVKSGSKLSYEAFGGKYFVEADFSGAITANTAIPYNYYDMPYTALQSNLDRITSGKVTLPNAFKEPATININKAEYTQLDYISELFAQNPNRTGDLSRSLQLVTNTGEPATIQQVANEALRGKIEAFNKMQQMNKALIGAGQRPRFTTDQLFEEVFNLKPKDGYSLVDVMDSMSYEHAYKSIDDVAEKVKLGDRLAQNNTNKPAAVSFTNKAELAVNHYEKAKASLAIEAAKTRTTLANDAAPFVKMVSQLIQKHPAYKQATDVMSLAIGSSRLETGNLGRNFLQTNFNAAENIPLKAMTAIAEIDTQIQKSVNSIIKPFTDKLSQVNPVEFSAFVQEMRRGWVVEPELEAVSNGYLLKLDWKNAENAYANRSIAKNRYPTTAEDAMKYVGDPFSSEYKPLVLSAETADIAKTLDQLQKQYLNEHNSLNKVFGKTTVKPRNFHVPPKNFAAKDMVALIDEYEQPVLFVGGNTPKQAMEAAKKEQALLPQTTTLVSGNAIKERHLFDAENQLFNMKDYSDVLEQAFSSGSYGPVRSSIGNITPVGKDAMSEISDQLNKQFLALGKRAKIANFTNELDYANRMLAQESSKTVDTNVWADYKKAITGGNRTASPSTLVGKAYTTFDDMLYTINSIASDKRFTKESNKLAKMFSQEDTWVNRATNQLFAPNEFKQLKETFGASDNAAELADEFLRRTIPAIRVSSPKATMSTISRVMSVAMLRLCNLGFAATNILSLGGTAPAVTRALTKRSYETAEEHAARIGAFGYNVGKDHKFTGFDFFTASADTLHWAFTDEGKSVLRSATKQGYFDTSASLMTQVLVDPSLTKTQKGVKKVIDTLSYVSDNSEALSHVIPFMVGYRLATKSGFIESDKAAFAFAKQFTDDVVGNYSAAVKPAIHRQALGIPVSLFWTYMQNYGQRLFDYIENKDTRALASQALAQFAVFGERSVPGISTINKYFTPEDSGETPFTKLQRMYGDTTARTLYYGPVSAFTGLDFSSKGSMDFNRSPVPTTIDQFAGVSVVKNILQGMGETTDHIVENKSIDATRLAEIWQNYAPVPFMRSTIDLSLGYTTDKQGQMITEDTRNAVEVSANLLAMKSVDETTSREQWNAVRLAELKQRDAISRLRKDVRSMWRGGEIDGEVVLDAAVRYTRAGGKPDNALKYITDNIQPALINKNNLKALALVKQGTEKAFTEAMGLLSLNKPSVNQNEDMPTISPENSTALDFFSGIE